MPELCRFLGISIKMQYDDHPRESMDSQSIDQRRNSLGYCCRTFCVVCHSKGVLQCGHGLDRSLIESPHAGHGTSVSLFIHAFPRTAAPSPNRSTSQKLSLPVSAIPGRLPQNQRQMSWACLLIALMTFRVFSLPVAFDRGSTTLPRPPCARAGGRRSGRVQRTRTRAPYP